MWDCLSLLCCFWMALVASLCLVVFFGRIVDEFDFAIEIDRARFLFCCF
jgi:hypothetical protein